MTGSKRTTILRDRRMPSPGMTAWILVAVGSLYGCGDGTSGPAGARAAEAERMEEQKLWRAADEAWTGIGEDASAPAKLRAEAWSRTAALRADRLADPAGAEAALQSALFHEPDADRRKELHTRIGEYAARVPAARPDRSPPGGARAIATVGGDSVSLEELLYAWKRDHPEENLAPEKINEYIQEYMTTLTLAEGARAMNLQDKTTFRLEMRHYERYLLNKALLATIVPQISEEEALKYYEENKSQFLEPPKALASHIVVRERAEADRVGERLRAGEAFDAVAADTSLDRETLPEGCRIGWLTEEEGFIPSVGWIPNLSGWLVHAEEGATTGPIESNRGFHWLEVTEKREAAPYPFEKIKDNVEEGLKRGTYLTKKQELLAKLKNDIPVRIDQNALGDGFREMQKSWPRADAGTGPKAPSHSHTHDHPHGAH